MVQDATNEKIRFKPPAWSIALALVFLVGYPVGMMARGFAPLLSGVFVGAAILLLFAYGVAWVIFRASGRNNKVGGIAFGVLGSLLLVMGVLNVSDAMGFREARAKALALQNKSGATMDGTSTQQPSRAASRRSRDRLGESQAAEQERTRARTVNSGSETRTPAEPDPEPVRHPEWRAFGVQFANDIALTTRGGEFRNSQDRQRFDRLHPAEAKLARAHIALREYVMPTNRARDDAWDAVGNGGIVVIADVVNQTDSSRIEAMRENFRVWSRAATESVEAYAKRETIVDLLGDVNAGEEAAFLAGLDEQIGTLGLKGKAEARSRAADAAIAFIDFLEEHKESIRVRDRRVSITDPALELPMQEHAALVRSAMKKCLPWDRARR